MDKQRKKITILGGTGFVGQHLCARLAHDGYRVRVLSRRPERAKALTVLPGVLVEKADIHEQKSLNQALQNTDVLINLVGVLNERGHHGQGFHKVHVELAHKVINACRENNISRLLQMSALNADAAHGSSHYLRSKGEAENYLHRYESNALHVTSFRPSVIFGPGDSFLNRFADLLKYSPGFMCLPVPDSQYSPVYVGDVARIMAQSIADPSTYNQHYELCGPRTYTLKALVAYVSEVSQTPRRIIGLSNGLSKMLASIMEYIPGKPFSKDNYRSSLTPSVCRKPFPIQLCGHAATPLESVAPQYLRGCLKQQQLDAYRRA